MSAKIHSSAAWKTDNVAESALRPQKWGLNTEDDVLFGRRMK